MSYWELLLFFIALIGSALYSGLETGVVSVNRLRLQHLVRQKKRGATIVQRFVEQPDHLLGTTLAGTNLCNVLISVTSASIAVRWLGANGLWVASLFSTFMLLIFGEYLPKAWFRSFPAYRVLPWAHFLQWSGFVFYPISAAIMQLARLLIPARSEAEESNLRFITREELLHLAQEGEKTGEFTSDERRMMHGVMQLTAKTCTDIMIPRSRMITVKPDTNGSDLLDLARNHHVSRLPMYDPGQQQFTGLVHILDVLLAGNEQERTAREFARPPQYVQADTRIDQLLPRMRLTRQPLALVRDDKEHVIGLVSIEDILEEIVGQL